MAAQMITKFYFTDNGTVLMIFASRMVTIPS